ncbi:YlxR family protein [Deinococcus sedimenti]|uniref:YlxR domain-containing protein n=1 Tax=Deinococcus sedimenti TaxID=1867090 RepID=A0ABQ2S0F9_9DEIO|nr:YlxR family protein [Deinococcus sedimenti]GGR85754.1 hypothetical protein GCM10008960_11100 [Deinococcus sedimenti]
MTAPSPTSPTTRHVPERTCVACRRRRAQGEFLRLSRNADGQWQVQAGPRQGRGAYVCADTPACWAEKRLRRAFGAQAPAVAQRLSSTDLPRA